MLKVTIYPEAGPDVHLPQRWLPVQVLVVALCFFLNMLDGMDVVILSYVAPSLSAAWHIPPDKLGIVFSAGFAGMATGGLVLAPLADIFGRRPLVVVSLIIMALGMVLSGLGGNVTQLILSRLIVGVGIGSVVVAMAALTAEYAPPHHRHFAITLLQAGYPIGATLTGFVVAHVIGGYGWQKILIGAGVVTAAMVPLAVFLLPESLSFLLVRRRRGKSRPAESVRCRADQNNFVALVGFHHLLCTALFHRHMDPKTGRGCGLKCLTRDLCRRSLQYRWCSRHCVAGLDCILAGFAAPHFDFLRPGHDCHGAIRRQRLPPADDAIPCVSDRLFCNGWVRGALSACGGDLPIAHSGDGHRLGRRNEPAWRRRWSRFGRLSSRR